MCNTLYGVVLSSKIPLFESNDTVAEQTSTVVQGPLPAMTQQL